MDAQWTVTHFFEKQENKNHYHKMYFYSISSNILIEYDHINTTYYSEQWKKLLILLF